MFVVGFLLVILSLLISIYLFNQHTMSAPASAEDEKVMLELAATLLRCDVFLSPPALHACVHQSVSILFSASCLIVALTVFLCICTFLCMSSCLPGFSVVLVVS